MQKIYKIKNFQVNISACQGTYISLRVYFGCIFCLYIYENRPKMPFFKQKSPKRGFFLEQVTGVGPARISLGS